MPQPTSHPDLPTFTTLQPGTHLSLPTTTRHSTSPTLIILCTWMGAAPRHIAKYAAAYRRLYPHSTLLLLQTATFDVLHPLASHQASRLASARRIVSEHVARVRGLEFARSSTSLSSDLSASEKDLLANLSTSAPTASDISLHAWSNGGAYTAALLAAQLRARLPTGIPGPALPLRALILDSAPGKASLRRSVSAIMVTFARWPLLLRALARGAVWGGLLVFFVFTRLLAKQRGGIIGYARRGLLDPELFGQVKGAAKMRRAYVYSRGDEMVWWEDVREHARAARDMGEGVAEEVYGEDSKHVGHAMVDGERYWGLVKLVNAV